MSFQERPSNIQQNVPNIKTLHEFSKDCMVSLEGIEFADLAGWLTM